MATIKLTFKYGRNIFSKNEFKPFVKKLWPSARFLGFKDGRLFPSISVHHSEFEATKYQIPKSSQLVDIDWHEMNVVEKLILGASYPSAKNNFLSLPDSDIKIITNRKK